MRIHIISNLFAPDELAGASLYTDLAAFLRDAGHDVRVTTTFSYYPAWKLSEEDEGVVSRDEVLDGIPVRRVSMSVPANPTGRGRLLSDASFLWSLMRRGRFPGWTPDVVLTALPMLSQCLAQRFLYWFRGVPRLIIVQDFVVDAALELGILKFPGVGGLLRAIEGWALRSADSITTISPGMLQKLERRIGAGRKTAFFPNWIHQSLDREIKRQSVPRPERESLRLFYSGNLGVKQGLPGFLAQFAESSAAETGWKLDIFGGGADKPRIEDTAMGMKGVCLGPVLDEPEYITSLLTTTACLVTQMPGTGTNFLPSKLLPALATATPVLAVCDASSPLASEVTEGGFGEVIEPDNPIQLRHCLERWRDDRDLLMQMSRKARERAGLYHRDTILPQYERELVRLTTGRSRKSAHSTVAQTKIH